MRQFNRGYALLFLFILVVALLAVRDLHQRIEGRYQAPLARMTDYTLDDWLKVLHLNEFLGDTTITPTPGNRLTSTPTPATP